MVEEVEVKNKLNVRWFVDVSSWSNTSEQWQKAMTLLPLEEQQKIGRFVFEKDQKLALASRLLQRKIIRHCFEEIPYKDIEIQRTPEGKPFWKRPLSYLTDESTRQWNFNISHHGTLVALASDTEYLIGCDVVQLTEKPRGVGEEEDFFSAFRSHFGPNEWSQIYAHPTSSLEYFYCFWSLKESYIKAIGIGLGFELLRAQFQLEEDKNNKRFVMYLDGTKANQWDFETKEVSEKKYFISIARGPHEEIWNPNQSAIIPPPPLSPSLSPSSTRTSSTSPTRVEIPWIQLTLRDFIQMK